MQASQSSGPRADAAAFFDFDFEQKLGIKMESLEDEAEPIPPSTIFYGVRGDQVYISLISAPIYRQL